MMLDICTVRTSLRASNDRKKYKQKHELHLFKKDDIVLDCVQTASHVLFQICGDNLASF